VCSGTSSWWFLRRTIPPFESFKCSVCVVDTCHGLFFLFDTGYFWIMPTSFSDPSRPYQATAEWYDAIYDARGRDCHREITRIAPLWAGDGRTSAARRILDVGCGTGAHFEALAAHGSITGVDRSEAMLVLARRRGIARTVEQGELESLSLGRRFDLIVSLFGAFGYLPDRPTLGQAMSRLARHLDSKGMILIEPPLFAERFEPPREDRTSTRFEGGTLTRTAHARRHGDALDIEFEWQHRSDQTGAIRAVTEVHQMLLLPSEVWLEEARDALGDGFEISIETEGPIGRGLLRAVRKDDATGSD
jgi:SAM-dependent methyltransferase